MKIKIETYIVIVIIFLLGFVFQYKYINEFPSHVHAWAQADRYALAIGFEKNNFNFFKPQTFVMNPEFPGNREIPMDESITAVDFPIHDFIPAIFMKITGTNNPCIFRLYILLYSFLGLFFIYKLAFLFNSDILKSIFILLFAATSPVFVYYQGGFLPTIPSLSNAIAGVYFYFKYRRLANKNYFLFSITFLTLSTLSRTTFAIPLIAVFAVEFLRFLKKEIRIGNKILPAVLSISLIAGYALYNNFLRNKYGSIFLNHPLPASNMKEVKEILKLAYKNWGTQYFSTTHYILFSVSAAGALFFFFKRNNKSEQRIRMSAFLLILFSGSVLFAILMLQQFQDHDYYFLDTFYLPVILFLIVFTCYIPKINFKYPAIISSCILLLLAFPLVTNAIDTQKNRRINNSWDRVTSTIEDFKESKKLLDSLKIDSKAKILVIGASSPNIPFILMDKKGYAVMSMKKQTIANALKWHYDYIVIQNDFFVSDIYPAYPEITSQIKKIADNGKISVCKLWNDKSQQNLIGFLGFDNQLPAFETKMTFDSTADMHWQNISATSDYFYSGNKSGHLQPNMEFGLTYKSFDIKALREKNRILFFSACFLRNTINDCEIVAVINNNGENSYYQSYNLKDLLLKKNSWEKVNLLFQLPKMKDKNDEFGIYMWNNGKSNLYYDDFAFKIY